MASAATSSLGLPPFRPTWELALSLVGHGMIALVLVMGELCTRPTEALFDPNKVMMVSAVALPKSTSAMPDKPMRTPDPPTGAPEAVVAPPPPTSSDMRFADPKAEKAKGQEKVVDRSQDREAMLNKARRENLLRDMNAAIGPEDHTATDPNGVDPSMAILGSGASGNMDPELARFVAGVKAAILPNWNVLPTTLKAHPDYEVIVLIPVGPDGKLGLGKVLKGTGDPSFDNSVIAAIARTGRLPPPPAKYRTSAAAGVQLGFAARDLQ